ncbi:Putative transcriptional coactivator Hfi1/Transcriptional adapter 1 [Septoria linicola]|uniref:Transcriptional coactivator Hfi1/Transcriptional adapter 1 n=1 Tax=Septoria linicola TaxID=215465 RepID=A0A9Q9EPK3_9PEZI|nr:Putative transcriptional coactivator Hfi1/Transcriptional adapter 1 [Septoria linicola]
MNPAELTLTISPSLTKATPATLKNGISAATLAPVGRTLVERINLEPIYAQLKTALGEQWTDYKAAITAFVLGSLNQAELSWVLQPLLSGNAIQTSDLSKNTTSTLQLHNQLVTAIYANTLRDAPATEVAPWVVATDKPSSTAKSSGAGGGVNDKAEERLKREIMSLHPRDRQRIKAVSDVAPKVAKQEGLRQIVDYGNELAVKPPGAGYGQNDQQGTTAGLARNNFDIEIQRRYAQPLASEQLEFPGLNDLQNKIEPICYEQGLTGGVQQGMLQGCAELVEQACEVYIKEMLSHFLAHARSNAVGRDGVQTHKFMRQFRMEEDDAERGVLQRNAGGLLPVEMQMQAQREPLRMADMRLGLGLSDSFLKQDRFLDEQIMLKHYPTVSPSSKSSINGLSGHLTNGIKRSGTAGPENADAMDIDSEFDCGHFKGVAKNDHDSVMGALDDCLLAAG